MARFSTSVIPHGTPIITRGLIIAHDSALTREMKWRSIRLATSKSAITPVLTGRITSTPSGVLPSIAFACAPYATGNLLPPTTLRATIDGSFNTIPRLFSYIRVLAVPRSMAKSLANNRFIIREISFSF